MARDKSIEILDVVKKFGEYTALAGVSLDVEKGEFVTFLGPSGCGKTTLLRCIAGFEAIDGGTILLNGRDMRSRPPETRNIGFVFQNYALFPTMTVAENVCFGLSLRKAAKSDQAKRVDEALEMVGLGGLGNRKPRQLSGGQQQRVALARALVLRPEVVLFDEPLSNLDANLRINMRAEIRRLQRESGFSAIFVTHDQEEAFALSDRVVVMSKGVVQQIGSPEDLYYQPKNAFLAGFLGHANVIKGTSVGQSHDGSLQIQMGPTVVEIPSNSPLPVGSQVTVSLRPERVGILPPTASEPKARVLYREFRGSSALFELDFGGLSLASEITAISQDSFRSLPGEGDEVSLKILGSDCVLVEA